MSQSTDILSYLQAGGTLTPLEALERFRCLRLSGRILDLRKEGHDIRMEMVEVQSGKRVARYSLPSKPAYHVEKSGQLSLVSP